MTSCKWVRRSLRKLSVDLKHRACPNTVGRLLRKQDFSLKSNRKGQTGKAHPDRDRQFRFIEDKREEFIAAGLPVVSVDAKKKELVGNFKNGGVAWCKQAECVNVYDFIQDAECRATPYAVYDVARNCGAVAVGVSSDTAEFAVDNLEQWLKREGRAAYPNADHMMVLADGGGSNGHRSRLFKSSLQDFADRNNMSVTVCHYPTGASKWNPVEHKLLSFISINWAGKPLESVGTMLGYIRGTTTQAGLSVRAWCNRKTYATKVAVTDARMESLCLERMSVCPKWNYTIRPGLYGSGP